MTRNWIGFGVSMPLLLRLRMGLLVLASMTLLGCATPAPNPEGAAFDPESPALPFDHHPEAAGTFTNRTFHN
jgi:hypothetical protein